MYNQPNYDHGVRREWLPCFAIFWIVISSIFVLLRLALRAAGRSSFLGFDDVSEHLEVAIMLSNESIGSDTTSLDLLHSFRSGRDLFIKCRIDR